MGNLNSRTFTNEDGTATMTHYVESDCYWFNPFCNNHAQTETYTYFGNNSPGTGATYSSIFGSYSSNLFLVSLGSFILLICLVSLVISIRRRRQEAYLHDREGILGVNYSPDKATSPSMQDLRLNNNDQLKIEQQEHWSVTPNNNLDDSEEGEEAGAEAGKSAAVDPSKARYKYQLRRLFSLKSHQVTTPERYISISELKFDQFDDFNEERGKPKAANGYELV